MSTIYVIGEGDPDGLVAELSRLGHSVVRAAEVSQHTDLGSASAVLGRVELFSRSDALRSAPCRRVGWHPRADVARALPLMGSALDDVLLVPLSPGDVQLALSRGERFARRALESEATLVGIDGGLRPTFEMVCRAARFEADVLLVGESGTGKERFARLLHDRSGRANGPFVAINCAAIPEHLLESELFGHVKGAFTDAHQDRVGVFERASGGTLLLDEVGDLPREMQVKLLRLLQERRITPVGGEVDRPVDVRVVSATSRDLEAMSREGSFREDLYFRLAVIPISVPALRERRQDLAALIDHFLRHFSERHLGHPDASFSVDARRDLEGRDWPGNVRELKNCIERLVVLSDDGRITLELVGREVPEARITKPVIDLRRSLKEVMQEVESQLIAETLKSTLGHRGACADRLGISKRTLLYKMKEYGLS